MAKVKKLKEIKRIRRTPQIELTNENNDSAIDFNELDCEHLEERFDFKSVNVVNNIVFVTTKLGEEYYIVKEEHEKLINDVLVLYHRNTKGDRSKFHREYKRFTNVFQIFGYIAKHENKIWDKVTPFEYRLRRMDNLLAECRN